MKQPIDVTPSASRLTTSLRDIGYDFVSAIADLVDNSIAAGATNIEVLISDGGGSPFVAVADDGGGMTTAQLREALRFGSRRTYLADELGRYGLGLKTASISQCRRVTVVTRSVPGTGRPRSLCLDLDHVEEVDRWEVQPPRRSELLRRVRAMLGNQPGTVVVWEELDRVLNTTRPDSGFARRKLSTLTAKTTEHLGMIFHRFLEGTALAMSTGVVHISVNGTKVKPWNPFAPEESNRLFLPPLTFEIDALGAIAPVHLERVVLPSRNRFSSAEEFERLAGPRKWTRQQGLYIYRADRLIQAGGWAGIRAADEHTKYGRAALYFHTTHDDLFQINVAKMRVALPAEVRAVLEKPLLELSHHADAAYRRDGDSRSRRSPGKPEETGAQDAREIGRAVLSAAMATDTYDQLAAIIDHLRVNDPEVTRSLGW
jgi:hypothetical protein